MTHLDAALHYARTFGWAVHPVNLKKRPTTEHGFKDATTDEMTIREYFKNGAQLSVRTGVESNLFVFDVDLDEEKGVNGYETLAYLEGRYGKLPHTPHQRTGRGGTQYFFRYVEGMDCTTGRIGAGIDTRGEGGYAVVAPSRNTKGAYEWIVSPDDAPLADVPQWLIDLMRKADEPATTEQSEDDQLRAAAAHWLGREVARVRSAADGKKHDTLRNSAVTLAGLVPLGLLTEHEIEQSLYAAIEGRATDTKNARQTILDGIDYGKARPWRADDLLKPAKRDTSTADADPETGEMLLPSEQVLRGLHALGYTFRLNECDDTIEVNGKPLDDIIEAEIKTRAWDAQIKPQGLIRAASLTEAAQNAYHPVKDYLTGLKWDGKNHIGQLAAHLDSDDPLVEYPDGKLNSLHAVYLKRWLVGAVAKVLDRKQNMMLVLSGPQNTGKSYFARWLCGGIPDRFLEGPIRVDDKDSSVRLMSRFVWEVSELDATTRRSDVSALKDFITRDEVTVRKSYGRHDTIKPAMASMIGTVNECAGFLSDESGNRRFFVTSITKIDWDYTKLDVNQVWAQAVALYRAGEPWRLLPCEATQQTARNQSYDVESALDGWLPKWFDLAAGDDALMTAADIIDHLRIKDIHLNGNERAQAMELSRVLKRLGVEKVRTNCWRGYRGIAPRDNPAPTYDNLPPEVVIRRKASQSPSDNVTTCDDLIPNDLQKGALRVEPSETSSAKNDLYSKEVVTGCHVVTEALGRQKDGDNLDSDVVTEVDTLRVIPRRPPNVNDLRRREREEAEAAAAAAQYGPLDEDDYVT